MEPITFSVAPNFINHIPPRNRDYYNFSVFGFSISEDWHMNINTLNLQIDANDGRGYQSIITNGVIQANPKNQKAYRCSIIPDMDRVGTRLCGQSLVGRDKHRFIIKYYPDEKYPDWAKINVSMNCEDDHGNATQDNYSFSVLGNRPYAYPYNSFYYSNDATHIEATCLYFGTALKGNTYNASFKLFWGKGIKTGIDLYDLNLFVHTPNNTDSGKEIVENGWIWVKDNSTETWINMTPSSLATMGSFALNESKIVDMKIVIPEDADYEGPVSVEFGLKQKRQSILGYRPLGTTLCGGWEINGMIHEQADHKLNVFMNVIGNDYEDYLSNFGVEVI